MKIALFYLFLILSVTVDAQTLFMEVEGTYTGKNLFIQNPFNDETGKFCTSKIKVNQFVIDSGLNSTAFEIRLDTMHFQLNDSISITFYHEENCLPKILHTSHHPASTFDVKSISIDTSGLLQWTTKNEEGRLTYTIQQFLWNKWISIGSVDGQGSIKHNEYVFKVLLKEGKNRIRVMQDISGKRRYSEIVEVVNENIKPASILKNTSKTLEFSREVHYEIYDGYGALVKTGVGKTVDISDLKKGGYYINYDNKESETILIGK